MHLKKVPSLMETFIVFHLYVTGWHFVARIFWVELKACYSSNRQNFS